MHLESLLQGGTGESAPTTGGTVGSSGAVLTEGGATTASTTEFSVALGALTADALEEQPAVATPEVDTGPDIGGVVAEIVGELPEVAVEPGPQFAVSVVAAQDGELGPQDIDLDATIGVVGSIAEVLPGGEAPEGAPGIPIVRGSSPGVADPSIVLPDAPTVVAGTPEQAAVVPTRGGEPSVQVSTTLGVLPTVAEGLDPERPSVAPSPGQAAQRPGVLAPQVAQNPAPESSTPAPADAGAPGAGPGATTATTNGRGFPGDGLVSATGATPASSADETVPVGRQTASGSAPPVETTSVEVERAASSSALETRAASRSEGNAEPTILAAVQPRVEARRARESASGIAAPRAVPTAPTEATNVDTVTPVAAIDAEEGSPGVALLRAGSDASLAPAIQGLTREAVQRQRARATPGQLSSVVGADPDASGATPAPGTTSPATPSTPTSVVARIDQPQGFAALAERIVNGLHMSAARGGSEIRLRVDPPGLGHIDVRVQLQDDGVRAVIVAEHEGTRTLLNGQQHLLEAALGRSELRLTGFSVDVSPDHGAADFHDAEHGDNDGASSPSDGARSDGESTDDAAPAAPLDAGRLSLRV